MALRSSPARGLVRLRARGPGASARPDARRRAPPLRQDRPHRRRPVQRTRDRPGLQVGQGRALGTRHRPRAAAADPALPARPARPRRDRAARRRLPRARRAAAHARDAARVAHATTCPGSRRTTTSTRTRSGSRSRRRASAPATYAKRIRAGDVKHDPKGDGCPSWCDLWPDLPGAARMTIVEAPTGLNDEQFAAVEAEGSVFVSAGAGTGKTSVLVERYVRAVCDRGLDVDSILVITYTRKAAGELRVADPRGARRPRPSGPRARARRSLDLDHPRLLQPAAQGAPVRRRPRSALPRARGRGRRRSPRRGVRAGARRVLRGRRRASICACSRPTARTGSGACSPASTRRCARRAGSSCSSSASGRRSPSAIASLRDAADGLAGDATATANQQRATPPRRCGSSARRARPSGSSTSPRSRAAAIRAASYEHARKAVERAALEELAARDRDLLQELLDRFAAEYADAKRRESAVDFEDLQLAARDLLRATTRRCATRCALRFRLVMVDEFQDTNGLQCELVDLVAAPGRDRGASPSATSSSRSTASATPTSASSASAVRSPVSCSTLRRNYRSRPQVLAAVNYLFDGAFGDEYQPLAASAEFADPVFGHPVELLVTDKASFDGYGRALADGRGPRDREARPRARRLRHRRCPARSSSSSLPGPTPSGTRRRCASRACRPTARRDAATSASSRSPTCSRISGCCTTATTTSRSPRSSPRRSSAISNDALVLLRRNATRRPLFTALEQGVAEGSRPRTSGCCAPSASATSGSSRLQRESGSSASASRSSPSTTTTSPCSRAGTAHGASRISASSAASRAQYEAIRGARPRGLRPLRPRAGCPRREGARGRRRGGGRRRGAPADDPRRQGPRVQGRDRGRRRARHRRAARRRRDRRALRRPVRLPDGAPDARRPAAGLRLRGGARGGARAGARRATPPLLRRDDACDRPADRLRRDRSRAQPAIARRRSAGCSTASERCEVPARSEDEPVELERGDARFLLRVDRLPRPGAVRGPSSPGRRRRPAGALHRAADRPPPVGARASRARRRARAAAARRAPAVLQRARPLRALLVPLLGGAGARAARRSRARIVGDGEASRRPCTRPRSETPSIACSSRSRSPSRSRPRATSSRTTVRRWYPAVARQEVDRIAGLVAAYCASPLARRVAALPGADRSGRSPSSTTACCSTAGSTCSRATASARSCSTTRRTRSATTIPREVVESEYRLQRLVYALACLRDGRERGRGRLRVPGAARGRRLGGVTDARP